MCGICGVWEYGASGGSIDQSLLARMRDEMTHRGPDDSGELVFDNARGGFGFRRLSIIDLSAAGHQPMHGCDERTWLAFNGEIYNHAKLREGLEERGHVYRSKTDSETILHLYEERGVDFVHDIEGDYGIAIWDATREQLVLVRDRIGVKPLYYYFKDGRFIFASEIKAILQHPAVTPDIDEKALYHYLTFLTTPAPSTLFRDIHKLPAGHLLILSRDGSLQIRQYWDALPPEQPIQRSDEEHKAEILRLLRDSIGKRMMSDVPFGVFLSGGVDSSANVALMSEQMTRPVDTFTVGFSDAEYLNELDSARRIAKQFGTNHHEVIISEKEMQDFLPGLVFHQDEPIADPVCVPLYYVSKLARDSGTIVIQVGEGADEIFSGYENYVRHLRIYENFWRHAENLPLALRRTVSNISRPALEATGRKRAAIELIRRLGADEPLFWGGVVVYDEALKPRVLSQRLRERLNGSSSIEVVNKYLKHIENERPESEFLARMTYLELKLRLPELLLMRVDKITMATSVEARVPFLDHHLVEYALGVPRSLKVEGASGKHILKRALEDILPRDLLYTRKRGFGAPVREWFRSALAEWFDSHVLQSTLRKRDLLDYAFVSKMLTEHRNQSNDWGFHLWALLNLSLWYERWIDPR
ncbi:MAG TPA: asparagine synthase (glutamine-hydrolyzing) [Pyrinomonadaceae bacterium]|nr:asparagine synthase (glutamine-hydrolyzing) [Pyrinomonadaceae bacterium]